MKKFMYVILATLLVAPATTFAALGGIGGFIDEARDLIDRLTIVAASLALLVFFWGLAKFIMKAGDAKGVEEGKSLMIWGVVALFVMVSVWGLVSFIQDELGIEDTSGVKIPGFFD